MGQGKVYLASRGRRQLSHTHVFLGGLLGEVVDVDCQEGVPGAVVWDGKYTH